MALKSFRRSLLGLVWAAVTIPVFILVAYQLRDDYQNRMASDQRELAHAAERASFTLSQSLRQLLTDLDRIASDGAVIRSLAMPILSPVTVKKIEEFMGRNPAAVSVMLIDKELFPVEVLPSQVLALNMSPYEDFLASLVDAPEVIRDPRPRLFIPDPSAPGAAAAEVLTPLGVKISNYQPVFVRPILVAGNSISKPFQVDGLLLINLSLEKLMADLAEAGQLDFDWVQLSNAKQQVFAKGDAEQLNHRERKPLLLGLDGIALELSVGRNLQGVWGQVIQAYQTQAAIVLLFLLLMLVLIKLLADKLGRPLRALTYVTSRMSANNFQATTPLPQDKASVQYQEFAEVFGLLGNMEATIRQQFSELHQANIGLESKVAERTAALQTNIQLLDQQHAAMRKLVNYALGLQQLESLDHLGEMTLQLAMQLGGQGFGLVLVRGDFFAGFEDFSHLPPALAELCRRHRRELQSYPQTMHLAQTVPELHCFALGASSTSYQGVLLTAKNSSSQQQSEALIVQCSVLAAALSQYNLRHSLHRLAHIDALTQLPNRHYFAARLAEKQQAFDPADSRSGFAVFVVDANGLKRVNDTYGHQHGDELLQLVANSLRSVMRANDTVARVGGDEFYLLLESADSAICESFAERLRSLNGKASLDLGVERVAVSFSFGYACTELDSLKNLLILADERMYFAKKKHYASKV